MIRYRVNAREKGHFCIGSKVIRYSVNAREKGHFCISKVIRYSVNAREKGHFCIGSKSDLVQRKREGKLTLLYRIKSDLVQCKRSLSFASVWQ